MPEEFINEILAELNLNNISKLFLEDYYDAEDFSNSSYYVARGAGKLVIVPYNYDFVIKIPFTGETPAFIYEHDYCAEEANFYNTIPAEIKMFFLPIRYYKTTAGGLNVYLQEKAGAILCDLDEDTIKPASRASRLKAESLNAAAFPTDWLAYAFDFYGDFIVDKLIDFAEKQSFFGDDLHEGNLGFSARTLKPIIIDYFDYCEE